MCSGQDQCGTPKENIYFCPHESINTDTYYISAGWRASLSNPIKSWDITIWVIRRRVPPPSFVCLFNNHTSHLRTEPLNKTIEQHYVVKRQKQPGIETANRSQQKLFCAMEFFLLNVRTHSLILVVRQQCVQSGPYNLHH